MRLKSWLWISVFALLISSVLVFAQDRGNQSKKGRDAMDHPNSSYPDGNRGWGNDESEREWREYLKQQKKAYKERAKASREEQKEYEKYLREQRKDRREDYRDEDYRQDGRGREQAWREYLRARNRSYKGYPRATRQEQADFDDYLRDRGYDRDSRYSDQDGIWWGGSGRPSNGACFYTDANFGGERFCLNSNERTTSVGGHYNDRISSIRVMGRARVTVYRHNNYGGSSRTYSSDAAHLGDFNDEITSIEVR